VQPAGLAVVWPIDFVISEDGTNFETFTVALTAEPVSMVQVSFSSLQNHLSFSPASIVFDYTDFNVTQSVRVSGIDNSICDGDNFDKILVASSSSDLWWECDEALRT
jgi:hypothetical protein